MVCERLAAAAQEMNLVLEEELLDHIIFWARNLPLEDLCQLQKSAPQVEDYLPSLETLGLSVRNYSSMDLYAPNRLALSSMRGELLSLGGPTAARLSGLSEQSKANMGRKWYFEVLHIQPLKVTPAPQCAHTQRPLLRRMLMRSTR